MIKMEFQVWERQQLEKMVNGSIKATKAQIKQFEAANKAEQLRTSKSRLNRYLTLLEKIRAL
jgi:hypothetical protein